MPDYDGRPDETSGRRVALWPLRIVFFPARAVTEVVFRTGIGAIVKVIDRDAGDVGSFEGSPWTFRPLLVLDAGLRPRIGLHAIVAGDTHALRLRGDFFGTNNFGVGAAPATWLLNGRGALELSTHYERRPDVVFHGLGARSPESAHRHLQVDRAAVGFTFRTWLPYGFDVAMGGGVRRVVAPAFYESETQVDLGGSYVAPSHFVAVSHDLRSRAGRGDKNLQPLVGSGVRVEADAEHAGSLDPGRRWIAWGGSFIGTIHFGKRRHLELATAVRFVDPLGLNPPPVLELASLGGDRWLRGHLAGRVRGRSAAVVSVRWSWPVWTWLDGFVQVDAGNAFDAHLRDVSARLLRLSATMGMRNTGRSGYVVEILGGVGTETIEEGARISSVRVLVAATRPL